MSFCGECGSTSRDKDGFCRGCGAPWPREPSLETSPESPLATSAAPPPPSTVSPLARFASHGLPNVKPKKVWVAVLLAVFVGPLGLLYCTTIGTFVMLFVSMVLLIRFGAITSTLIVLPIRALWAWRAARESSSTLV